MFRTMQTSSAACALCAVGARLGQWPGRGDCGPQGHPDLLCRCSAGGLEPADLPPGQGLPFPGCGQEMCGDKQGMSLT